MESHFNSNRIIRNTILLYIRMIVVTVVSFFTVRITLKVLGVEDYGIYNVVGGLVAFLSIVSATMSSASQRYLAFDLGKNNLDAYRNTFSLLFLIYFILTIIVFLVGEGLGPYFINNYLKIPDERINAAQWVYQFSLYSFCITLISTPYQASIIANERMGIFAFIGLFDAFSKLFLIIMLYWVYSDKLIAYAIFIFLISVANFIVQLWYCTKKIRGCIYRRYWNRKQFSEILGYTGWNLFGSVSATLCTSGLSVVLNMFFGPIINAAKGIADRVNAIVVSFATNFYQATAPQIIKTYSSMDIEHSRLLVFSSSKFSYYLVFVFACPVILGMPFLLNIWLDDSSVTEDMVVFSRLMLVYSLVNVFELPLTTLIRATGNIKKYQIYIGSITLSIIPICVVLFCMGFNSFWALITLTLVYFVAWFVRILIVRKQTGLSFRSYIKTVISPVAKVTLVTCVIIIAFVATCKTNEIILILFGFFISCSSVYFIGLNKMEKQILQNKLLSRIKR